MYYPKSQIKPNLFTNGDQYVYLRDETNYIGFYYSTSDGRYFTGKVLIMAQILNLFRYLLI